MSDKVRIRLLTGHFTWERDCFERESLILEICISTSPQHAMSFFFHSGQSAFKNDMLSMKTLNSNQEDVRRSAYDFDN